MTSLTTPDNILYWTNADPASLIGESAQQATSIQNAFTVRGGVYATPTILDALTTAAIGARAYMTSPGTGIEAVTWEAYTGSGVALKWHIVDTVRAATLANLNTFISTIAGTTDLSFVVGGLAFVAATQVFYRFTTTAGAKVPLGGLIPILPTSVAGTGVTLGSNGKVSFSAASTISVNGVFTSDFQHYRMMAKFTASTANTPIYKLRAAGTDVIAGNYFWDAYYGATSTSLARAIAGSATSMPILAAGSGTSFAYTLEIFDPADVTLQTGLIGASAVTNGQSYQPVGGGYGIAASQDGISIITSLGNATGTIHFYGYNTLA